MFEYIKLACAPGCKTIKEFIYETFEFILKDSDMPHRHQQLVNYAVDVFYNNYVTYTPNKQEEFIAAVQREMQTTNPEHRT